MSTVAAKHNAGLDLTGKVAAVSGGTQGIGAAVGKKFAQLGASVYIIGRNPELGNKVIEELKAAGKGRTGQTFEFLQADLSLVSNVKDLAKKLEHKTGSHGIDFLVQTQGGPPNGLLTMTPEGNETHFAIQVLSRFGLAYLLAKSGTLKESFVNVCAPNGSSGAPPDLEDLQLLKKQKELGRLRLLAASGARDSDATDGYIAQYHKEFPGIKAYHVFPGIVTTDGARNSGFPTPIVWAFTLASPIISRTFGNTADSYAEIPVYLASNPKSRNEVGLEFSNERLKSIPPKWTVEQPEKTKALWDRLIQIGDF